MRVLGSVQATRPAGKVRTSKLWVYDFRTGQHFTLRKHKLAHEHPHGFIDCYLPGKPRDEHTEAESFKAFDYHQLVARDKANLDITWLRNPDAEYSDNLQPPSRLPRKSSTACRPRSMNSPQSPKH